MTIPYRPLGIITAVIEQMNLEVTYVYEDLVFISHNAFLLRMGEQGRLVYLYFNQDSEPDKRDMMQNELMLLASEPGLEIINSGTYMMETREDEQLDIHFYETTTRQKESQ